ncbi:transposase family protein [Streptomyces sp. NPDC000348]|uniref:transposase family protein n=1 Tax=Streptomyces sp. NPDC000348 TaxID=3364538 RepID=UPI0036B1548B
MPDPRARRGIRYPWTALLTAAAAAVLAGAVSLTAIGEWVADAPQRVLALLGFRPDPLTGLIRPPPATTVRLVLAAGDALDRAIGRFLQERKAPAPGRSTTTPPTCTNAGLTTWPSSSGTIPDSMSASTAFPGATSAWTTSSEPGPTTATRSAV